MPNTNPTAPDLIGALEALRDAQDNFQAKQCAVESARQRRGAAVRAALDAGLTVIQVARILGVTRGRIYQITSVVPADTD